MQQAKYHIVTLGCQMNKSDSERLASLLDSLGLQEVDRLKEADLVILNSCSVRQTAEDRVFGKVRELAELKTTHTALYAKMAKPLQFSETKLSGLFSLSSG